MYRLKSQCIGSAHRFVNSPAPDLTTQLLELSTQLTAPSTRPPALVLQLTQLSASRLYRLSTQVRRPRFIELTPRLPPTQNVPLRPSSDLPSRLLILDSTRILTTTQIELRPVDSCSTLVSIIKVLFVPTTVNEVTPACRRRGHHVFCEIQL